MHQKGKRILSFCGGVLSSKALLLWQSAWLLNEKHRGNTLSHVCPAGHIISHSSLMFPLFTVTSVTHLSSILLKKVSHTIIPSPPVSGLMAVYLRKGLGVHLLFKLNHLSDGLFWDRPIPLAMLQGTGLLSQSFKTFGFFLLRTCVLFVFSIADWTELKERIERLFKVWFID